MDSVAPKNRSRRIVARVAAALGSLLAILLLLAAVIDANWLRGPLERRASAATGRVVRIAGPMHLHLFSFTPALSLAGLSISDPPSAPSGELLSLPRGSIAIRLLPLFIGRLVVERIELDQPVLNLWMDAAGRDNWDLHANAQQPASGRSANLPVIHQLVVNDGHLDFHDAKRRLNFAGQINAANRSAARASGDFELKGDGQINGKPFSLEVHGDSLLGVTADRPYRFASDLRAAGTQLSLQGSITRPFDLNDFQAHLTAAGPDLADLYYLTGLPFVNTARYSLSGNVQRHGSQIRIDSLDGRLGDTDLHGSLEVDLGGKLPLLVANLDSRRLDLSDLLPAFGGPARNGGGVGAPAPEKIAGSQAAPAGLLPDAKLDVARLRSANARVHYRADDIKANRLRLAHFDFQLRLEDGVLRLQPFVFTLPEGRVRGELVIDAHSDVPHSRADVRVQDVRLREFASAGSANPPFEGELQARAQLAGSGDSVHAVAANADGRVTIVLPGGAMRKSLAELSGIDVLHGLGLLLTKNSEETGIRCGVAAFDVRDGTMGVQKLVLDTDPVKITGRGSIDLGPETWDIELRGAPKHPSLLRLRTPITITGPLGKPTVGVDKVALIKQLAVSGALAAATPIAALIAFVDPGLSKNANCSALLEAAAPAAQGAPATPPKVPLAAAP